MKKYLWIHLLLLVSACHTPVDTEIPKHDSIMATPPLITDTGFAKTIMDTTEETSSENFIDTKNIQPSTLIAFAKQWQHVPYLYASSDPQKGFDCSGFISFVFSHFNIDVPRSSIDFTHKGSRVSLQEARPGDLILFTGTDSTLREVGHMGIVVDHSDSLRFIHSTSGKANGVTITALNSYYRGRFVSVRRIFSN